VIHLGLTPAQIGRLTPRILSALWKEHEERELRHDSRYASIIEWIARANLTRKDGRPFQTSDFLPMVAHARFHAKELASGKQRKRITTPEEAVLYFQQSSEEALNEMLNFTAVHNAGIEQRSGRK
jgi:hypothetical protein